MIEKNKKVIIVSKKTNEKISEALREKLEAEGVEVVVEYEPNELVENLEKIVELPIVNRAELPDLFLENINQKSLKKYVPNKIGRENKAKFVKIHLPTLLFLCFVIECTLGIRFCYLSRKNQEDPHEDRNSVTRK